MASTYPLEVVQADRWCKAHPEFTPEELQKALASEPWECSVHAQSRCFTDHQNMNWMRSLCPCGSSTYSEESERWLEGAYFLSAAWI
jgi:hypothetical protein